MRPPEYPALKWANGEFELLKERYAPTVASLTAGPFLVTMKAGKEKRI